MLSREQATEEAFELKLRDLNGKLIQNLYWKKGEGNLRINLGSFPAGIYFVNEINDSKSFSKKLIKH